MNNWQKIGIIVLALASVWYVKTTFFPTEFTPKQPPVKKPSDIVLDEKNTEKPEEKTEKEYVNIYFIGQNENGQEVYKAVKRVYDVEHDGSKLRFAVKTLVSGPSSEERKNKIYSEIPKTTRLISVIESKEGSMINLSRDFEMGGGTDSLYKRLFQLIKTANLNTERPVYLYLNGELAEVVGGEGIMLSQPLNERSLN